MLKRVAIWIARWTLLPLSSIAQKLLAAARIREQWGTLPSTCGVDASVICLNHKLVELPEHGIIEREVELKASMGGKICLKNGVHIRYRSVLVADGGRIEIGCSYVGWDVFMWTAGADLLIGNNVLLAPYCAILAANHVFADRDQTIASQGVSSKGIVIEDDVWIGSHASILDGVTVGRGSVVAAGAVVTKDVPRYSVVAGVPAQVISRRGGGQARSVPHGDNLVSQS